ncbi:MAG TPA: elongation factor P, partial [Bacteroidia bacterium]|nr:elongation factor P [Bacteroidia bacterium]
MADTGDIGIGSVIRFNGDLYQVVEYQHRTPGNLRAFYQAKLRNLKNGKLAENRFRSGEQVEVARVEYKTMQYLYKDGENLVVM